ncbi:hypothetical protein PR202_gb07941 [Eleusine coracana subsp. coracana]|uniref:Retrotransposon gag domain-containing protein n=1 Tax=Eleusine coracana subsp. coracana TaxID=191504 RepID=A0AAV5EB06_ELECO|nr:hypothetical protein PR202_gb07941 [Eleusine coracana subsp. coracana]
MPKKKGIQLVVSKTSRSKKADRMITRQLMNYRSVTAVDQEGRADRITYADWISALTLKWMVLRRRWLCSRPQQRKMLQSLDDRQNPPLTDNRDDRRRHDDRDRHDNDGNWRRRHDEDVGPRHRRSPTTSPDRQRRSPTLTDDEIDGIKAYIPRLCIARWPKGFKPVSIKKYDGQTNPQEWLQLYSTAIQSAGGDSYIMANYLPVCLDPAVWIWLTSLPEESVTSWGDLNRKLIESFQVTCNRPGNHFDLTRIKQKGDEPLRDYIKRFCAKKTEIPNVPDQQIITAFLGGIRSDDLVREIGRRNHDLKLTAQECFKIADKYASGESALDDIRGKGKEKRSDKPESSKKDKKRKPDNAVNTVDRFQKNPWTNQSSTDELLSGICPWHPKGNHKAKDCYYLKGG